MGKVHVNEASSWKLFGSIAVLKCFLFRNILKYYFFLKKLFLILVYQNDLKISKILI